MPFQVYDASGRVKLAYTSSLLTFPITTISGNTTLDSTYYTVLVNATCTVTLPDAAANTGRFFKLKLIASGSTLTINTTSSQTIDGSLTQVINTQYTSIKVVSDGSNWYIA